MLGVKNCSSLKRKLTSAETSRKRKPTSPYAFDGSASDGSASDHTLSPSKIVRSVNDNFEEDSPTFSATSFYSSKGQGGYLTPAERQKRREDIGEILPTKPPVEKQRTTKTKSHQSLSKGGHTSKGIQRARRSGKTLQKSKTKGKIGDKSHPKSLVASSSKTVTKSSPNKKTINKSPKKSPKKSSPSKRTPRKSPRKGVKKAVKLYLQGLKKNTKAARRATAMAGQRTTTDKGKAVVKDLVVEIKNKQQYKGASKKLDLENEKLTNKGVSGEDTDINDDICVIAPSPKYSTKKRTMRSKEESEEFIPGKDVRRSPRKSVKTCSNHAPGDNQVHVVTDYKERVDKHNFLEGFEPDTPDSMTPQILQKVSPKKANVAVVTAATITPPISPSNMKLISSTPHTCSSATSSPLQQNKLNVMKKMTDKDNLAQMTLDLGQKHFGAVTCETCGMVYTAAHPEDETLHDKFHRKYLSSIKFRGWKNERILQEFDDGRIIMVLYDDPKNHIKKVEEIRQLVDQELGFLEGGNVACKSSCKVLLFITTEKKVAGCLIAEEISKGYRVIADQPKEMAGSSEEQLQFEQQRAWCCHTEPESAMCGISRIWVTSQERRKQIATKLLDCLRNFFMFGTILPKASIAFSDPTPDGKMLATSYIGTPQFLVYKYQ